MQSLLSLMLASTMACGGTGGRFLVTLAQHPELCFQNASLDPVAVYVVHRGVERFIGHVEPGRSVRLALPDEPTLLTDDDVYIFVAPPGVRSRALGSSRAVDGQMGVVLSDPQPGRFLTSLDWALVDGHITSLQRRPRQH